MSREEHPVVDSVVSRRMAKVRGRNTKPEAALRKALRSLGLRGYRVSYQPLPDFRRTADVAFLGSKVAVMVDGCYWHHCPEHYRPANQRSTFWSTKIAGNVARDEETNRVLTERGWRVVRIWEHEDPLTAAHRVAKLVQERRSVRRSSRQETLYLDRPM